MYINELFVFSVERTFFLNLFQGQLVNDVKLHLCLFCMDFWMEFFENQPGKVEIFENITKILTKYLIDKINHEFFFV